MYWLSLIHILEIADKSSTVEDFKTGILRLLETCRIENEAAEEAREQIRLLLHYDGQNVHELSTGQDMSVQTIRPVSYTHLEVGLKESELQRNLSFPLCGTYKNI